MRAMCQIQTKYNYPRAAYTSKKIGIDLKNEPKKQKQKFRHKLATEADSSLQRGGKFQQISAGLIIHK